MELVDNASIVADKIRNGVLDINVQELFLSTVIKGLLYNLNKEIKVRNNYVPHMILHTGDDIMWIESKGYDASIEPINISNENWVYSVIPKCVVTPGSVDLDVGQLSSPYSIGNIVYSGDDGVYSFSGEFRRIPLKLGIELKYYTDSFTDTLELMQYIITNLAFIRTFDIMYMGQKIKCSYKIPENFSDEHTMELDGAMTDNREHSISLSIEVETNMPVFNNRTIMPYKIVTKPIANIHTSINEAE